VLIALATMLETGAGARCRGKSATLRR